jgi:tRNA-dependent cyclodipeptide synthase
MSPGNGFFSRKRVEIAICGFARLSGNVAVVVPDTIAIHTYRALGYAERAAKERVKKHGLLLKGRCRRALELNGALSPDSQVRMLDWENDISSGSNYQSAYAEVKGLFETHQRFREDILQTARMFLESKASSSPISEAAAAECSHYLLKELAFLRICRGILGTDVLIPYHKHFAVAADFCDGVYGDPVSGVGWVVYDIDLFDENGEPSGGLDVEQ